MIIYNLQQKMKTWEEETRDVYKDACKQESVPVSVSVVDLL